MSFIITIKKLLDNFLKFMCIFLCGAMVVLVSWQVISRFVLQDPSAISEELANICFVWTALLGAALLYGERGHMAISFIPEKLGPVKQHILFIISEIFTMAMACWILTYGGMNIAMNAMSQTNAAMLWLKIGQIYSVVPLVGVCIVFYSIYNILESIMILSGKKKVGV
ncbi:2,3-diketo-L-gulonate TRAP transporter small permease protein YiaM [Anaerobiospirillum thomasii]|uniref:TRAP transporter small permease protein n=2 Tax=Anaerobiospirillum thomasii TaxID=179995 RepID=A0A2X0V4P2_9GAMM|nr:2,3-diketo-L-gulonate TRAP transporter small permease protein YiaM [Anaerobiospirillum thomasii]SPT71966.1 2,3-diketo-L-gulonate TRAP transporter small permease protein YiaM [Anaerobiospirillum thomasii]